jgi:hypothetical protein
VFFLIVLHGFQIRNQLANFAWHRQQGARSERLLTRSFSTELSRRQFLKSSTAAALSAAFVASGGFAKADAEVLQR